ncbi:hypothetical protein [Streptomyces sp. t39]|uniref:hypothetical protein n=1 Tax=Streptomyces sp. t39 TaxID=1828156 RepID=UPI0011CE2660|nr:hypothetical protein [Streptomyces sp. t39]TXS34975.1 hypothetical protein EAO77_38135 [Streptomyces sp. t39]
MPVPRTTGAAAPLSAPVRELVALLETLHTAGAGRDSRLLVLVKAAQSLTPPQLAEAAAALRTVGGHPAQANGLLREAGRRLATQELVRLSGRLRGEGRHDDADLVLESAAKHRGAAELHELLDALRTPAGQQGASARSAHSLRDVQVVRDAGGPRLTARPLWGQPLGPAAGQGPRSLPGGRALATEPGPVYPQPPGPTTAPQPEPAARGAAYAAPSRSDGTASPTTPPGPAPFTPYWFAVPAPRQLVAEDFTSRVVAELRPGVWYRAVGRYGLALVATTEDGRRGLLWDTGGLYIG